MEMGPECSRVHISAGPQKSMQRRKGFAKNRHHWSKYDTQRLPRQALPSHTGYPARCRSSALFMVEIREIAATIMLDSSCMVATSRSSKAPGDEERTSKTPRVRR